MKEEADFNIESKPMRDITEKENISYQLEKDNQNSLGIFQELYPVSRVLYIGGNKTLSQEEMHLENISNAYLTLPQPTITTPVTNSDVECFKLIEEISKSSSEVPNSYILQDKSESVSDTNSIPEQNVKIMDNTFSNLDADIDNRELKEVKINESEDEFIHHKTYQQKLLISQENIQVIVENNNSLLECNPRKEIIGSPEVECEATQSSVQEGDSLEISEADITKKKVKHEVKEAISQEVTEDLHIQEEDSVIFKETDQDGYAVSEFHEESLVEEEVNRLTKISLTVLHTGGVDFVDTSPENLTNIEKTTYEQPIETAEALTENTEITAQISTEKQSDLTEESTHHLKELINKGTKSKETHANDYNDAEEISNQLEDKSIQELSSKQLKDEFTQQYFTVLEETEMKLADNNSTNQQQETFGELIPDNTNVATDEHPINRLESSIKSQEVSIEQLYDGSTGKIVEQYVEQSYTSKVSSKLSDLGEDSKQYTDVDQISNEKSLYTDESNNKLSDVYDAAVEPETSTKKHSEVDKVVKAATNPVDVIQGKITVQETIQKVTCFKENAEVKKITTEQIETPAEKNVVIIQEFPEQQLGTQQELIKQQMVVLEISMNTSAEATKGESSEQHVNETILSTEQQVDEQISSNQKVEENMLYTEQQMDEQIPATKEQVDVQISSTEQQQDENILSSKNQLEEHITAEQQMDIQISSTEQQLDQHILSTEQQVDQHILCSEQLMSEQIFTEQQVDAHKSSTEQQVNEHKLSTEQQIDEHILSTEHQVDKHISNEQQVDEHIVPSAHQLDEHISSTEQKVDEHILPSKHQVDEHISSTEQQVDEHIIPSEHQVEEHISSTEKKVDEHILPSEHQVDEHISTEQQVDEHIIPTEHQVEEYISTEKILDEHILPSEHQLDKHITSTEQKVIELILPSEHQVGEHRSTEQVDEHILPSGHQVDEHLSSTEKYLDEHGLPSEYQVDEHISYTEQKVDENILPSEHQVDKHISTEQQVGEHILTSEHQVDEHISTKQQVDEHILPSGHQVDEHISTEQHVPEHISEQTADSVQKFADPSIVEVNIAHPKIEQTSSDEGVASEQLSDSVTVTHQGSEQVSGKEVASEQLTDHVKATIEHRLDAETPMCLAEVSTNTSGLGKECSMQPINVEQPSNDKTIHICNESNKNVTDICDANVELEASNKKQEKVELITNVQLLKLSTKQPVDIAYESTDQQGDIERDSNEQQLVLLETCINTSDDTPDDILEESIKQHVDKEISSEQTDDVNKMANSSIVQVNVACTEILQTSAKEVSEQLPKATKVSNGLLKDAEKSCIKQSITMTKEKLNQLGDNASKNVKVSEPIKESVDTDGSLINQQHILTSCSVKSKDVDVSPLQLEDEVKSIELKENVIRPPPVHQIDLIEVSVDKPLRLENESMVIQHLGIADQTFNDQVVDERLFTNKPIAAEKCDGQLVDVKDVDGNISNTLLSDTMKLSSGEMSVATVEPKQLVDVENVYFESTTKETKLSTEPLMIVEEISQHLEDIELSNNNKKYVKSSVYPLENPTDVSLDKMLDSNCRPDQSEYISVKSVGHDISAEVSTLEYLSDIARETTDQLAHETVSLTEHSPTKVKDLIEQPADITDTSINKSPDKEKYFSKQEVELDKKASKELAYIVQTSVGLSNLGGEEETANTEVLNPPIDISEAPNVQEPSYNQSTAFQQLCSMISSTGDQSDVKDVKLCEPSVSECEIPSEQLEHIEATASQNGETEVIYKSNQTDVKNISKKKLKDIENASSLEILETIKVFTNQSLDLSETSSNKMKNEADILLDKITDVLTSNEQLIENEQNYVKKMCTEYSPTATEEKKITEQIIDISKESTKKMSVLEVFTGKNKGLTYSTEQFDTKEFSAEELVNKLAVANEDFETFRCQSDTEKASSLQTTREEENIVQLPVHADQSTHKKTSVLSDSNTEEVVNVTKSSDQVAEVL